MYNKIYALNSNLWLFTFFYTNKQCDEKLLCVLVPNQFIKLKQTICI